MRLKAFLICLMIVTVRGWDRLLHPGIWAEDGSFFLLEILNRHWSVFLQPYQGYFHLYNFSVLSLFTLFPLSVLPAMITLASFILFSWVMSMFAGSRYRHLVSSDLSRLFVVFGFCILPGTQEILGNICNTHRILAVYFFLFCLRSFQDRFKLYELLFCFFVVGSAGEVVAFLPLILFRTYQRFQTSKKIEMIYEELILILIVLGWTIANIASVKTNTSIHHYPDLARMARATSAAFVFHFSILPIIGWRLGENLFAFYPVMFWLFSGAIIFYLLKNIWSNKNSNQIILYFGILGWCIIQEISWVVRPIDISVYDPFFPSMWWGQTRFVYVLAFASFFLWSIIFAQKSKKWVVSFVLIYFILANSLKISAYGDVSYWPSIAEKLEQSMKTGCPKKVTVPIFPGGWEFFYISPKTEVTCHD